MFSYIKDHKVWFLAALAPIAFALGWSSHRFLTPPQYKEKVVIKETTKESADYAKSSELQALLKMVRDMSQKKNVVTTRDVVKAPDGTITTHVVTTDHTVTDTHATTDATVASKTKEEFKLWKETVRVEERVIEKLVTTHSDYALDLTAGYDFARIFGRGTDFNLIPVPGLVIQLGVSRRLIGSVWVNATVQSTGVAGLGLKMEF